jgi:hypothetical protein
MSHAMRTGVAGKSKLVCRNQIGGVVPDGAEDGCRRQDGAPVPDGGDTCPYSYYREGARVARSSGRRVAR